MKISNNRYLASSISPTGTFVPVLCPHSVLDSALILLPFCSRSALVLLSFCSHSSLLFQLQMEVRREASVMDPVERSRDPVWMIILSFVALNAKASSSMQLIFAPSKSPALLIPDSPALLSKSQMVNSFLLRNESRMRAEWEQNESRMRAFRRMGAEGEQNESGMRARVRAERAEWKQNTKVDPHIVFTEGKKEDPLTVATKEASSLQVTVCDIYGSTLIPPRIVLTSCNLNWHRLISSDLISIPLPIMSICMSLCLSVFFLFDSICLSVYVCSCVCLSVCVLFVCLNVCMTHSTLILLILALICSHSTLIPL